VLNPVPELFGTATNNLHPIAEIELDHRPDKKRDPFRCGIDEHQPHPVEGHGEWEGRNTPTRAEISYEQSSVGTVVDEGATVAVSMFDVAVDVPRPEQAEPAGLRQNRP